MTPEGEVTETIARQRAEIDELRRLVAAERFARDLRDALTMASATGTIGAPIGYGPLLEFIVTSAADMVEANAASLLVIDAERDDLVFEAAFGETPAGAEEFRVPLGQGVAGLVAMTGEPMVVSHSDEDGLDVSDVARAIGWVPTTIMCVPLSFGDRVIGVLEILDKQDGATFTADDLEAVVVLAGVSAVAIEQCRTQSKMTTLLVDIIEGVDGVPDYDRHGLSSLARAFTTDLGTRSGYLGAMELARLVGRITRHGDAAATACVGLLTHFAQFLEAHPGDRDDSPW